LDRVHELPFISAPGDLDRERDACRGAISDVNASDAMPLKILLVSVGLMQDDSIVGFRAAVADNIRQYSYFIQVFQDDWGPRTCFGECSFRGWNAATTATCQCVRSTRERSTRS
jgi:hypothetical protein